MAQSCARVDAAVLASPVARGHRSDAHRRREGERSGRALDVDRRCDGGRGMVAAAGSRPESRTAQGAVLILPGFLSGSEAYSDMEGTLRDMGFVAEVVPVKQSDWYPTLWGSSFEFYLEPLAELIDDMHAKFGSLSLVGHSAGGWLARICLGNKEYNGQLWDRGGKVHTLITLGAPHLSKELYPFGRFKETVTGPRDVTLPDAATGSSLQFANHFYPSADSLDNVKVVCVVAKCTTGKPLTLPERWQFYSQLKRIPKELAREDFAFTSYKANCGDGSVAGDGVCDLATALLPTAEHLILDGVYHSPGKGVSWYGSKDVIPQWSKYIAPQ